MTFRRVLLPEPLAPIRPRVFDSSSSKLTWRSAQKSSASSRRNRMTRSFSDLSWCRVKRFEMSWTRTATATSDLQLLCEVALGSGEEPLCQPHENHRHEDDGDQAAEVFAVARLVQGLDGAAGGVQDHAFVNSPQDPYDDVGNGVEEVDRLSTVGRQR